MQIGHRVSSPVHIPFTGPFITCSRAAQVSVQLDEEDVQVRGQNLAPGNCY